MRRDLVSRPEAFGSDLDLNASAEAAENGAVADSARNATPIRNAIGVETSGSSGFLPPVSRGQDCSAAGGVDAAELAAS